MEEAFSYKLAIKLHKTPPKWVFKFGLPRCDSDHLPSRPTGQSRKYEPARSEM
jgi:hypothetical protein